VYNRVSLERGELMYTVESIRRIYNNGTGAYLEVRPDRDGLGLVEVTPDSRDGKAFVVNREEARLLARVLIEVLEDLARNDPQTTGATDRSEGSAQPEGSAQKELREDLEAWEARARRVLLCRCGHPLVDHFASAHRRDCLVQGCSCWEFTQEEQGI
jgi:hypothetical protein